MHYNVENISVHPRCGKSLNMLRRETGRQQCFQHGCEWGHLYLWELFKCITCGRRFFNFIHFLVIAACLRPYLLETITNMIPVMHNSHKIVVWLLMSVSTVWINHTGVIPVVHNSHRMVVSRDMSVSTEGIDHLYMIRGLDMLSYGPTVVLSSWLSLNVTMMPRVWQAKYKYAKSL